MDKKRYSISESFNFAIEGIISSLQSEKNMRIHIFVSILTIILAIVTGVSKIELLFLTFSISLVLICELFNTAIEFTIDTLQKKYHPIAKKAKDISAGAVLISCVNAILVGYLIFMHQFKADTKSLFSTIKYSYTDLIAVIIALILIIVLAIKAITKNEYPLSGGMPSGHSAVAFSLWTGIFFITDNMVILVSSFVLAFLVAQSRVESKIHSIWEVLVGGAIGGSVTFIILNFLKLKL